MRRTPPRRDRERLWRTLANGRAQLFTEAVADPIPVYGERIRWRDGRAYREWVPTRSKLAAALVLGYEGALPDPGGRWLYLGAASGTTSSHVADLVGPQGRVYAVERSPRPFAKLLRLSGRYPNLLPILADARTPGEYRGFVPPVDGVYCDIAQPDQVEIATANAREFLRVGGTLLLALKTASLGRERTPEEHSAEAVRRLRPLFRLGPPTRLDPIHRRHYLVDGRALPALADEPAGAPRSIARPAGR